MELMPEIVSRTSIRSFLPRPVPPEALSRIAEAARLAPSAKNRQAWRFVIVQDAVKKASIQAASYGQDQVGSAAAVIACCSTNVDYKMPNGQLSYPVDLAIAGSFMMLQAVHEGLGTCIVTMFDEAQVRELLTVPYGMKIVMLLLVGYADGTALAAPRLPLSRIVTHEHW